MKFVLRRSVSFASRSLITDFWEKIIYECMLTGSYNIFPKVTWKEKDYLRKKPDLKSKNRFLKH